MIDLFSKFFIISLTFKIVISSNNNNCPVVTCDGTPKTSANTTCVSYDPGYNSISLSKCLDNQLCVFNYPIYLLSNFSKSQVSNNLSCLYMPLQLNGGENNSLPAPFFNIFGVETDFCTNNYNCGSNICVNFRCIGIGINKTCTDSYMCSVSMYCDKISNICTPRVNDGKKCITDDYCINTSGCLNGKCLTLNFLNAGISLNNTNNSDARFCISGWANKQNVCEDLINVGDAPYLCAGLNMTCRYNSSITYSIVSLLNCNCDIITGKALCPLGTNTVQYINYIEAYLNTLWYPCHYYNKGNCNLVTQLSRYYLLNTSFLWSGFSPINSDFWPCLAPTNYPVFDPTCLSATSCVKNGTSNGSRIYFLGILSMITILLILT